jgi:cupin fold WbuC family metalloprotein
MTGVPRLRCITRQDLAALSGAAATTPRRRKNLNLHADLDDPVQRLFNAIEPGSYVRPHRHPGPARWELMAVVAGRFILLIFDDDGVVQERVELNAETPVAEIPSATWHTLTALEPRSVLLEVKRGPYAPAGPEDFAAWSPPEGSAAAAVLEYWFRQARVGERAPRGDPPGL